MDSNKSIDGLTTRRSKKAPSSGSTPKSTKKPTTKTTRKTAQRKSTSKSTAKKAVRRPASKTLNDISKPTSTKADAPINNTPAETPASDISTETIANEAPADTLSDTTKATHISTTEDFLTPTQVFNFDENTGELQASTADQTTQASDALSSDQASTKPKKAKKPVSKKRKIITSIALAIVLLLIGGVIWLVVWGNDIIAKITGGQGNIFDLFTFVEPTYEPLKTDANGRTNILAFGTSGYNMEGDEGDGTHDGAQLTDSIMVISLNQDTGDVAMLSLPRDLKASPTCTATGKINEVYWCNNMDGTNEQAGAEALMEEVGSILNIDFQYYAHLNWGSLIQIVDQLGGITVTLDEDIEDYYYTGAVFEAGQPYTIDGGQALGLARARHGTTGGDFSRGASQQKILIGIKDKIQEKGLSLTDLIGLANTLGDNLRTNFNVEELKTLAHLASEFDFNTMRQISLLEPEALMTTGNINGISYVLPAGGTGYYTRIQNYIAKMLSNNPSVYEDATILVLNGTETPGLAATEQKTLEDEGYDNITIDDAPAGEYTDKYTIYSLNAEKPGTKKALESRYNLESQTPEALPAGIPTDYDFVIILGGTPTESE
ncbi:LCP family protein [Candidatus Saccharibacteria bacterium]|nr:LCP family protein [Candidatus Saccharibacteria bacterium]